MYIAGIIFWQRVANDLFAIVVSCVHWWYALKEKQNRSFFFSCVPGLLKCRDLTCGVGRVSMCSETLRVESGQARRWLKFHGTGRVRSGAGWVPLTRPDPRRLALPVKRQYFSEIFDLMAGMSGFTYTWYRVAHDGPLYFRRPCNIK